MTHHGTAENLGSPEGDKTLRHCLFIPGILSTKEAMFAQYGMNNALVQEYGEGNVTTFNSAVSTDEPNHNRYKELADVIMDRAPKGPLDIVLYSLGATEFLFAKKIIKKRDKNFFKDPQVQSNIHFVKIAESGSSIGFIERMRYVREVLKIRKGEPLESLYAFPPQDVPFAKLRTIFSSKSNHGMAYQTIPFESRGTNEAFLTSQDIYVRTEHDKSLGEAVAHNDVSAAQKISKQRRLALDAPTQGVLAGTPGEQAIKGKIKLGGWQGLRLLWNAIGSKPMRHLKDLYQMGYPVTSLVPEFDLLTTAFKSSRFYNSITDTAKYLRVMEGATHDGVYLQVREWAKAIFSRGQREPVTA